MPASLKPQAKSSPQSTQNHPISTGITSNDLLILENKLKTDFEVKIQSQQSKSLDVLAIFITLFTFISVNVSIFQKVSDEKAIFFMLLISACSITLVGTLFLVSEWSWRRFWIMISGVVLIILMPIFWWMISKISVLNNHVFDLELKWTWTTISSENNNH